MAQVNTFSGLPRGKVWHKLPPMKTYSYIPQGICAKQIFFGLEDGKIHDLSFVSGCPGNLQALGRLLEGQEASKAIALLKGNTCGNKPTSCADQLAIALEDALQRDAS